MHFVTILNHIILISDSIHWRWYIIETGPVWIETFLNKNVFYHNNCVTFYLEINICMQMLTNETIGRKELSIQDRIN